MSNNDLDEQGDDLDKQGNGGGRAKTCPVCGAENEPEASVCSGCSFTFEEGESSPGTNNSADMECPNCGAVISKGDTTCIVCGEVVESVAEPEAEPMPEMEETAIGEEEVTITCPTCSAELPEGTTGCFICGADLTPALEEGLPGEEAPAGEGWDLGVVGGEEPEEGEEKPEVLEEDLETLSVEEAPEQEEAEPVEEEEAEEEPEEEPAEKEEYELGINEFLCPSCSKPVTIGSSRCSNCWADLPDMTRCPKCENVIPMESESCPDCFARLEMGVLVEEPPEAEEEFISEEPEEALMPEEEEEDYIEEITEVYGVECPFCNAVINAGEDICPECGMPLIEGEMREELALDDEGVRKPERDWYRIIAFALVIILLASAMTPFLLPLPHVDRDRIRIDGSFSDWEPIANHTDALEGLNPNIDIIDYRLISDAFNVYFYMQVAGQMFGDADGDTARIFIDLDQDESTGYRIMGIGADYQLRVFGHAGQVESSSCMIFDNARAHNDLNGFESHCPSVPHTVDTTEDDDKFEVRVDREDIGMNIAQPINVVYYLGNADGEHDFSDTPITNTGSLLFVRQSSAVAATGLVSLAQPQALALDLLLIGDDIDINGISITGCTVSNIPGSMADGESANVAANVNMAPLNAGDFVNVEASPSDFDAGDASVVVTGYGAFAYAYSAPSLIQIDGAFADWLDAGGNMKGLGVSDAVDDVMSRNRVSAFDAPRLDATEFRTEQENDNLNLYLDVEGEMFAGFDVPVQEDMHFETLPSTTRSQPKQTRQNYNATIGTRFASPDIRPPAIYKPQKGEDAVLVFLDINNDSSDGYLVNGIGADRLLDIRGQYGKVRNVTVYEFSAGVDQNMESWDEITASSARAASDGTGMEAQVSLSDLGLSIGNEFAVYFHVLDWNRNGDLGDEVLWDTAISSRRGTRNPVPDDKIISGIVYEADGITPKNSTVIADYPKYDCFLVSSFKIVEYSSPEDGAYHFAVDNSDTISLYATDGAFINNTESVTTGPSGPPYTTVKNLNLTYTASPYTAKNFKAYNYYSVLLDWDIDTLPPGGYRIYRSSEVQLPISQLIFDYTDYIGETLNDWYIDDTVITGETYYYFIASMDSDNDTVLSFTPLEAIYQAGEDPSFPYIIYGFVKLPDNTLVPGADVTVQTCNMTNDLISYSTTTDPIGRYLITLQPTEYDYRNKTVWCNGSLGDLRGFNTTMTYWGNGSSRCDIILYPPNITVNKTVDFAVASPGQALTYTIWITNTDTWNATIVWVNDTLPDEFIYNSDNSSDAVTDGWATGVNYNSWGQIHNWTFYNVTPGNHSFNIYGLINSTTPDNTTMINWVFCNYTAVGNKTISVGGNFTKDNATTLVIVSNITVNKTVDLAYAYPGDTLTYTIYFNNTGGTDAVYMWINDTLPPEVTFIDHTADDPLETTSAPYFIPPFTQIGQNLYFEFANVPAGPHKFDITVQVNSGIVNNTTATNWVFCNYTTEFVKGPESNASANTTIIRPDITVNKTVNTGQELPGNFLTYTIWFNNTNETASFVWINDTLPDLTLIQYVSDTANLVTGATFDYRIVAGNPLQYRFSNVQNGPHSFTITVQILESTLFCTDLNNTVSCDFSPAGYTTYDNATTHVIQPVIDIVKIVNQTFAYPGETVNYTIYFNNTDTADATNVWINDTLPPEVTYVSDNANTLPEHLSSGVSGQQLWFNFTNVGPGVHYFNITVQLNGSLSEGDWFLNWAYIEYTQANGLKYGPYSDSALVIVRGGPLIIVEKTASPDEANTGDIISYRIRFTNNGNGNASYVWINDTLPLGVTYLSDNANTLPEYASSGQSGRFLWFNFTNVTPGPHSFIINVTVTNDTDGTLLRNWVFCNYTSVTGVHGPESSDFADVTLNRPVITVEKYIDKAVASPGSLLNYTIWYNNSGSYPADVWINDTIPDGTTYLAAVSSFGVPLPPPGSLTLRWFLPNVPPGDHMGWIILRINDTTPSGTYLNNTIELNYTCPSSGYEFPGSVADATTIVSVMVIEKTVDLANANPGDYLNYTIYFNNTANFTMSYVWINDTLPTGVTYVNDTAASSLGIYYDSSGVSGQYLFFNFTNLPLGFYSFVITVQIDVGLMPGTWLNNTAYLDYTDDVGNSLPGSNDTAETMVNRPIIVVEKAVDKTMAYQGDEITYTIWFNNTGSCNASHVWVNDTLPDWLLGVSWTMNPPTLDYDPPIISVDGRNYSWHIRNLPPGMGYYITITATIDPTIPDDTYITNYVTCEYEMENGVGWNTSANATTWVVCATIDVGKSVDLAQAYPGDTLTYTIWFNNTGNGTAAYVWINDTLPIGVVYQIDTANTIPGFDFPVWIVGQVLHFNFTNVAPGVYSFTVTVSINTDVPETTLVNWAFCNYTLGNGLKLEESSDWANTTIIRPNITVVKTVNTDEANPGDYLVYTIYFNNTGSGVADEVRIEDLLPTWAIFTGIHTAATIPGVHIFVAPNGASGRFLYFNFTDVQPGIHSFTITVLVDSATPDCPMLINNVTCRYSWETGTGTWWGETTTDNATTHINRPTITVEKEVDYSVASPGFFLNYTITFTNWDSGNALFVWINDTLPLGVQYVGDTAGNFPGATLANKGDSGRYLWFNYTDVATGSYSFQVTVWIDDGYVHSPGDELWNWVRLNYTAENGYSMFPSVDWALTIISDISIVKTVNETNAGPDDWLQYTIYFNNTGSTNAAYIWINDTLPSGVTWQNDTAWMLLPEFAGTWNDSTTWYYNFTDVAPGDYSFVINVTVDPVDPGTILENWAYLNFTNDVGMKLHESKDNAITIVDRADITVEKTVDLAIAEPGDFLVYTIWFNNTGEIPATFVWINDTLPAWVTYQSDTSATSPTSSPYWASSGDSGQYLWFNFSNVDPGVHSFTITVRVNDNTPNGTDLINTVTCDYRTGGYQYAGSIDWASTIVYRAMITVEKYVDLDEATIGETLYYLIVFNNTGWANADVNISDILPTWMIYSGFLDIGNHILVNSDVSGQYLWFNFTNVAPGFHYLIIYVMVDSAAQHCNYLTNWVFLNHSNSNGVQFNMSSDSAVTHIIVPDVFIIKDVDRYVASPGDYLTYGIWFANTNPNSTAGWVWINDTLPNGVQYISDTAASFPGATLDSKGNSGQYLWFNFTNVEFGIYFFTITVYIDPTVTNGTLLTNNVTLNYTATTGLELPGDEDNATTLITILAVVKVVSQEIVMIGDNITYTIFFNNTGNFTIPYVWINDTLPGGVDYISDTANMSAGSSSANFTGGWNDSVTWYYNFTDVEPGTHWFTITVQVNNSNPPGALLENMVQLNYTDDQGYEMIGSIDWARSWVAEPILEISKEVNLNDASPGDQLVYTITIWNNGTDATGMVWVTDTLPGWLTYISDTSQTSLTSAPYWVSSGDSGQNLWFNFTGIGPGESCIFTITVSVNLDTPDWTNITNWAYVEYESPSGYPMGDPIGDDATTTIHKPIIDVDKTVDLAVANPGDTLIYTIWYNNTGSGIAGDLWINDTLPTEVQYQSDTSGLPLGDHIWVGQFHSWHFTNVLPGSWSFTITVTIDTSIPNCRWFNNSAFWNYTSANHITPADVVQNESNNATTHVIAPVIVINKTVDLPIASPGDTLIYTIFFNNTGADTAANVWINDTLPSGVTYVWDSANVFNWTAGNTRYYTFTNVPPGNHFFTIIVTINDDVFDTTELNNTVTCDYTVENGFRFNRTEDWAITTIYRPIMSLVKVADAYYVTLGDLVNYTIYFNNSGSGNASFVWITDILPDDVTWISDNATDLGGTSEQSGRFLYFNFTNVPNGNYWFNITVQVNTNITDAWILATNWAFCNYSMESGVINGPLSDFADILIRRPTISVEKSVNLATAGYNETLTYTIWFNNTGADIASFVWINDTLPADVTYVSDTNATEGGVWTGYWNWTFTNVTPGVHSFIIVVTVNPGASSPVTNNVTLNYTASNDYLLEGSWDEAITVITAMAVVKVATDYVVIVGQQYNYTIWFNNTGGSNATWVWIVDTLPGDVTYINNSANTDPTSAPYYVSNGTSGQTLWFNFTNVTPGAHWFNITVQVNNVPPNTELWNTVQLNYTDVNNVSRPGSEVSILTIVAGPIIDIVKTVDMSVAYPNDYLNYTIYINNTGTANATYVWVNDTLPAGLIDISTNASDVPGYVNDLYNPFNRVWYFEFQNLAPGNYWFNITVQIDPTDPTIYNGRILNNTVECYYNVSIYGWSSEDYALTRVIRPVIDVDKMVDMPVAAPHDILTYVIWFNNTGSTAPYVWVNDTLPAGVIYLDDTNGSCPGVSTRQYMGIVFGARVWYFTGVLPGLHFFTIRVRVDTSVFDGEELTNSVRCEYKIPNGYSWNTTALAMTTIRMPQFQIVKVVDKSSAYPTEVLTYTIWYNNTGTLTSPWVRIEDTMPIGVTYRGVSGAPHPWRSGNHLRWDFYVVAPGTHSFRFTVTINSNTADGLVLRNYVWCNFTLPNHQWMDDPNPDIAETRVIRPIITVDKIVDKAVAYPGDYLYYTIYFNNTGNGTAGTIWINDMLPAGVTNLIPVSGPSPVNQVGRRVWWEITDPNYLSPGTHSFTFRVLVMSSLTDGTWLTNWAFCNYTGPWQSDYLMFEETWDRADTLVGLPEINVEKVANVATVNPGGVIVYTIYYNNTGSVGASAVTITDTLPDWVTYYSDDSGITPSIFGNSYIWYFGDVSPGPHSFNITVNVSSSMNLEDGMILINEATCEYGIHTDSGWVDLPPSIDWANVTVIRPDIALVKTVNLDVAYPYDILVYTIYFDNVGSDNAAFLWLNDTLPDWAIYINDTAWNVSGAVFVGKWNLGNVWYFNFTDVTPGLHNFTIWVRVNTSVPDGFVMANLATCDYKAESNLSFLQESYYAITLIRRPIITIQKMVNQTNAVPGNNLTYTIYFNNTGSGTAAYLWINDTLPAGVTYVNDTNGTGILTINGRLYSWYFTNVTPGLHSFTIIVTIDLNVTAAALENNVTCEYKAENGFNYAPSYSIAFTLLAPPEGPVIITTPPPPRYAGDPFNLTAFATDDNGIVQVRIYYTDIEGMQHSGIMSPLLVDAEGRGHYYFTVPAQMWKGIVTYFVWANDTDDLTNRTGYYDVMIILPPYYVWGMVIPTESENIANAMVIVYNNETNDTVITTTDPTGYYIVDLGKFASGYLDGQGLTVFVIDSDMLWYGYSSGIIDILHYIANPQLPTEEAGIIDSGGHPFQRINVYLNEIPEFSTILVPVMISLIAFVLYRRRKTKKN